VCLAIDDDGVCVCVCLQFPAYFSRIMESFRKMLATGINCKDKWLQMDAELAGKRFSQLIKAMAELTIHLNLQDAKR